MTFFMHGINPTDSQFLPFSFKEGTETEGSNGLTSFLSCLSSELVERIGNKNCFPDKLGSPSSVWSSAIFSFHVSCGVRAG